MQTRHTVMNRKNTAAGMAMLATLMTCSAISSEAKAADPPMVKIEFVGADPEPAPGLTKVTPPGSLKPIYLHPKPELTGDDVASAKVTQTERGDAAIHLVFSGEGSKKMQQFTQAFLLKHMAILVDGKLLCAPRIVSTISHEAQITGNFDRAEAERIVAGIRGQKSP